MKNQITYIACTLMMLLIGACRDEDKNPIPDFTKSSIPVFFQKETDSGFINFVELDETTLSFDVDRLGTEGVSSIDVLVTFNNNETGESETVTHSSVSSFPQNISLTIDQLIGLFPTNVVTRDTLTLGDSFVIGGNVLLEDGRYLEGGYSPNVVANDPVFLTYNVACASDLAGTYDLTLVSGTNGEASSLANIAIAQVAPGYYEIADATMDIFGPDFPIAYRFTDICGTLTADAQSVDFGSQITIKFNPGTTVDPATGVITFSIEYISPSCCGLAGIKTVFTATPK